jgi:hypothetical protein
MAWLKVSFKVRNSLLVDGFTGSDDWFDFELSFSVTVPAIFPAASRPIPLRGVPRLRAGLELYSLEAFVAALRSG